MTINFNTFQQYLTLLLKQTSDNGSLNIWKKIHSLSLNLCFKYQVVYTKNDIIYLIQTFMIKN